MDTEHAVCARCGADIALIPQGKHWEWVSADTTKRGNAMLTRWCQGTVTSPVQVHAPAEVAAQRGSGPS